MPDSVVTDGKAVKSSARGGIVRLIIRACFFLLAILFGIQVLRSELAGILPSMSPFLAVCSAVGARRITVWFLLCLPVFLMSCWKGRWFCSRICPTGFLLEYAGRLRPGSKAKYVLWPRFGNVVLLLAFGGALAGYPLLMWFDPLSIFNGFTAVWHKPVTIISTLPAAMLVVIVLFSIWRPNAWCHRCCPLGALQENMGRVFHGSADGQKHDKEGRRALLALLAGSFAGVIARNFMWGRRSVIRPPGSIEEGKFSAVCVRCGNCIRACQKRENIIYPDMGSSGIDGLLTPVIKMVPGYCSEWCNECNKVCPTNAIARMSLDEKRNISIGTARVLKEKCLAWDKKQSCLVCHEYCAYHALQLVDKDGVKCPEVDADICRGCGLCQAVCPAEERAIIVEGGVQKKLKPVAV